MTPEQQFLKLGLVLPAPAAPVGSYVPFVRFGDVVMTSGQLPMKDGKLAFAGKVGTDLTLEQGAEAARTAVLNALSQVVSAARGFDNIERILRLAVFVNSAPGFIDQPKVANGASDLMVAIFGDAGRHARSALGSNELPLNAAVEIELMAQIRS